MFPAPAATTMRCRQRPSKRRGVHIVVTALLTFSAAAPRAIVSKKTDREQTRNAMKSTSVFTALAVTAGCAADAFAQAYPSRPITIIVPFPAGGPTDTLARILGERMRISLGQTIIVETSPARARPSVSAAPSSPRPTAIRSASATGPAMSGRRDLSGSLRRAAGLRRCR